MALSTTSSIHCATKLLKMKGIILAFSYESSSSSLLGIEHDIENAKRYMREIVKIPEEEIHVFTGEHPLLQQKVETLLTSSSKRFSFEFGPHVIYITGHGVLKSYLRLDDECHEAPCLVQVKSSFLSTKNKTVAFDLRRALSKVRYGIEILVIVDMCHAEGIIDVSDSSISAAVTVINSCLAEEKSAATEYGSAFSYHVFEYLCNHKRRSFKEIEDYVNANIDPRISSVHKIRQTCNCKSNSGDTLWEWCVGLKREMMLQSLDQGLMCLKH